MKAWIAVLLVTAGASLLKAMGPLALGRRPLPDSARRVVGFMAPALLAGLIVVELGGDGVHGLDWPQIAGLYRELARLTGSAVVELNHAIAVAEVDGADAGLDLVDRLDLDGYQYFHSTRADLLRRLGRAGEAWTEYTRALELAHSGPERRFLERRLAEVGAPTDR